MRPAVKRIASMTCVAALLFSLAACSSTSAASSGSTEGAGTSTQGEGASPEGQPPEKPGGQGGFGGSGTVTQGTSANTINADSSVYTETYESDGDDENALRVDGAEVTLDDITVKKSGGNSSNTEDGDFYGQNAALLATNGATVSIRNARILSSAQNGNGVFSYGEGTTVNISDSVITTTADNSGGLQTTGGGTTNASDLTIETSGNSSAAIRSDRGGGTVNADGGSYTSNGLNSPAVYSTADITVKNAALTANNSEALVIEGQNSITLENCTVSGSMSENGTSADENTHNIMIYQSMSGDAEVGTSNFSMIGGSPEVKGMAITFNGATVDFGAFISAIINFLIVALVVFALVKALNKAQAAGEKLVSGKKEEEPKKVPPVCPYCLDEVKVGATKCCHCGSDLPEPAKETIKK